jgi:hypothetical protein
MIERTGYKGGLIVLVAAVAVIAGAGSGAWRYGAIIIGVPVIGAFHLAYVAADRLRQRRTGAGAAAGGSSGADGVEAGGGADGGDGDGGADGGGDGGGGADGGT